MGGADLVQSFSMRIAGLFVFLGFVCLGCKEKGDVDSAPDPAALKAQQDLITRRDKLLEDRKKLQTEKEKLDIEIKAIEAKGGDASEQKKKAADLDTQLQSSNDTLVELLNNKFDAISKSADKSSNVAAREAAIAQREKAVADREARAADREKQIAQRDYEAAQRWKDSCSTGTPMIIQGSAPKGGYDKKDVTQLLTKAKKEMSKKGILTSDLPQAAQSLESEANGAVKDNDMTKAYVAAAQLVGVVDSITVNRQFIQAKHARLSQQAKASKVDEATNKQFAEILSDVLQKFGDGDFNAANRRLNQLASLLAKKT